MTEITLSKSLEILHSGGWVMYPLGFIAFLIFAIGGGVLGRYRRGNLQSGTEPEWRRWVHHPAEANGHAGNIIRYVLTNDMQRRAVSRKFDEVRSTLVVPVDQRLRVLKMLVAAAPLLGLLGTVMGMFKTFQGIAVGARGETMAMASVGIQEALTATETGLLIAVLGVFMTLFVARRRAVLHQALEQLEAVTLQERFSDSVLVLKPMPNRRTVPQAEEMAVIKPHGAFDDDLNPTTA